ncbi:MAG: hypothetical protein AB8B56_15965 [Crocinitomicaceae bacterium]
MPNIQNYRECPYAETWLEDGITVQKYKKGLRVTLEIAQTLVSERLAVADGVTRPGLADISGLYWTTDSKAMKFLSSDDATMLVSAGGFYISNFAQRMAMRFFLSLSKEPPIPTKIFDKREDAMEWLKQFTLDKLN